MMTTDQVKNVTYVYTQLMESEKLRGGWDEIDESMHYLGWIEDDQIAREADVAYEIHKRGKVKCALEHPGKECFVPNIVEAVGAILDLWRENGQLHKNNRYILEFYLAYTQAQMVVVY